ncbi:Uncharacterised protein [Neisseria animalis]|nr:Uncharacterised protein [Neisseria animalis]
MLIRHYTENPSAILLFMLKTSSRPLFRQHSQTATLHQAAKPFCPILQTAWFSGKPSKAVCKITFSLHSISSDNAPPSQTTEPQTIPVIRAATCCFNSFAKPILGAKSRSAVPLRVNKRDNRRQTPPVPALMYNSRPNPTKKPSAKSASNGCDDADGL